MFDVPSRTITYSSFTPLPIVKALYKVRKNITPSKTSTPVHAIAATGSLSYYSHLVICSPETYIDPYSKCISRITTGNKRHAESATYPICGVYWPHPTKGDITGIVSPPALRLENNDALTGNKKILRHA